MKNTLKNIFSLAVFLSFYFLYYSTANAENYFFDDFSGSLTNWNQDLGSNIGTFWYIENQELLGRTDTGGDTKIYPIISNLPNNFTIEFDLKNTSGVDVPIFIKLSPNKQNYYQIGFRFNDPSWSQDNNNITVIKSNGEQYELVDQYPSVKINRSVDITQNVWHKVKIEVESRWIRVFFDSIKVIDYFDGTNTILWSGDIGLMNHSGNIPKETINNFDNFLVRSNGDPVITNKIFVIPGLGASWNEMAMVFGQSVSPSDWKMTPFVKNYDQLISALNQNGLIKNKDYFVWNYDWRKPISQIVTDFNNYVSSVGVSGNETINIVGHSLGGLVGRLWSQENPTKVNKIISLGSPHQGAIKAYEAWNGAKVSDGFDISSIALNVILQLQKKNYPNLVSTVRGFAPVLKDILPTFDYLKYNGAVVPYHENSYLELKNTSVSSIFSKFIGIVGTGENTKEWINLEARTVFDKILGIWDKGRPLSYLYGQGDVTVLKKSAKFEGDIYLEKISNHNNLPDLSINSIISELGLGKTIAVIAQNYSDMAVFYIGSPAKMTVNCGSGDVVDTDGWVTVNNKKVDDCVVKLLGTGNGDYHLVMGNSNEEDSWRYSEGSIVVGQTINMSVTDKNYWYSQLQKMTEDLLILYPANNNLKNLKNACQNKNMQAVIDNYFLFRKEKLSETKIMLMLDLLENIINLEKSGATIAEKEALKKSALNFKAIADKTTLLLSRIRISPNYWQSLNYSQASDKMIKNTYTGWLLAGKLYEIVWK